LKAASRGALSSEAQETEEVVGSSSKNKKIQKINQGRTSGTISGHETP
jgi:hypothetical protein